MLAAGETDVRLYRRELHIANSRIVPAGAGADNNLDVARKSMDETVVFVDE